MQKPHGGHLVKSFIDHSKIDKDLYVFEVSNELKKEIENISFGVYSPLSGFLNEADFTNVVKKGRLSNDLPWTIPLVLDADPNLAQTLKDSSEVALSNDNHIFGLMQVKDFYSFDKVACAKSIFLTDDLSHPGVHKFVNMKDNLIEGQIKLINSEYIFEDKFRLTPEQSRKEIENHGWKTTVAFQTRNVPHVAHEMLQKAALNVYDGLFINPLIGKKKSGDFKDEVIINSYSALIDNYYPKSKIIFSTLHTDMKYAGPREAIHHAIMRQNFGCSHIIIGRDHAGVGNYYSPFAAHDIFKDYQDLDIEPVFFPSFYYCKKCMSYMNERTCPHHDSEFREELSGTKMRKMFSSGELPPSHLMRPEISKVILSYPSPFVE